MKILAPFKTDTHTIHLPMLALLLASGPALSASAAQNETSRFSQNETSPPTSESSEFTAVTSTLDTGATGLADDHTGISVPEPGEWVLAPFGLAMVMLLMRRQR